MSVVRTCADWAKSRGISRCCGSAAHRQSYQSGRICTAPAARFTRRNFRLFEPLLRYFFGHGTLRVSNIYGMFLAQLPIRLLKIDLPTALRNIIKHYEFHDCLMCGNFFVFHWFYVDQHKLINKLTGKKFVDVSIKKFFLDIYFITLFKRRKKIKFIFF